MTQDKRARDAEIRKLIAVRAYEIWENHGRPHGYHAHHWREAEQEILSCLQDAGDTEEMRSAPRQPPRR
ncbi:MAG TPA: DUF2934 domain-containing protein [Rhodopila sp.]|jgi:hypothetical protein|nr:DUF2934 domain-containing protein [Rhodopila sp.]